MPGNELAKIQKDPSATQLTRLHRAVDKLIATIPETDERTSKDPLARARAIANSAAAKAAIVSGGLALPPGPLGLLTILPDLVAIWKIQAQMVADIAGTFGKAAFLTREQMLYCLFKHAAAQLVRDLVARVGERVLIRQASLHTMEKLIGRISVKISQRMIGESISRWLPLVGAIGVGAYAYYDTAQVAKTAIELFASEIVFVEEAGHPKPNGK